MLKKLFPIALVLVALLTGTTFAELCEEGAELWTWYGSDAADCEGYYGSYDEHLLHHPTRQAAVSSAMSEEDTAESNFSIHVPCGNGCTYSSSGPSYSAAYCQTGINLLNSWTYYFGELNAAINELYGCNTSIHDSWGGWDYWSYQADWSLYYFNLHAYECGEDLCETTTAQHTQVYESCRCPACS